MKAWFTLFKRNLFFSPIFSSFYAQYKRVNRFCLSFKGVMRANCSIALYKKRNESDSLCCSLQKSSESDLPSCSFWKEQRIDWLFFGRIGYLAWGILYHDGRIGRISCNPSYREASSWDGVGPMASLTLQKLQKWVCSKAIFKLEV